MKFKIHYTYPDGTEDELLLSGEIIEDIRERAFSEMERRGINSSNWWSERIYSPEGSE